MNVDNRAQFSDSTGVSPSLSPEILAEVVWKNYNRR